MKKTRIVLAAIIAVTAVFALITCATGKDIQSMRIPAGAERLMLENGGYAIYRFDLPAGQTWGNYGKISAEYMVDELNMAMAVRHWRLMGNYKEDFFKFALEETMRFVNFGDHIENEYGTGTNNGPFIIDNTPRTFARLGVKPNEWFTVEYDITGATGHAQLDRRNAIPAANATGPFYFGLGISGDGSMRGIYQLIRNITLHHKTDPSLNVISTGSGFPEPTFGGFSLMSSRESGPAR
ncbi:MAG: hypothetical protein FWC01_08790 [Treponema sp.]|nr:hypothetical protein [Treponema sp.]